MKWFGYLFLGVFLWQSSIFAQEKQVRMDSLLLVLKNTDNQTKKIQTLLLLSQNSQKSEASKYALEALQISEKAILPFWIAQSQWQLAKISQTQKHYTEAEQYFLAAVPKAEKLFSKKEKGFFFQDYGLVFTEQGKYKQALPNYLIALKFFQEENLSEEIAKATYACGVGYYRTGNYLEAENYFWQAQKLFSKQKKNIEESNCYNGIGACWEKKGMYDKALEKYLLSAKIKEDLGKSDLAANDYLSIGNIYNFYLKNLEEALSFYQKAYDIGSKTRHKRTLAQALNNIGLVHEKRNNLKEALEAYELALIYNEEISSLYGLNYNLRNLASVYKTLGQPEKALVYQNRCLALLKEKIGDQSLIATTLRQSSLNLITLKQFDEAEKRLKEALNITEQIQEYKELPKIYNDFAFLEESRGNFSEALAYLKISNRINDSIFTLQRDEQIAKLKTLYDTDKREQENKLLLQQNQLQQAQLQAKELSERQLIISAEKAEQENNYLETQNRLQEEALKQKDLLQKITNTEKEKQEKEAIQLRREKELQNKIIFQNNQIIIIGGIVGVFFAVLAYLFFRQKQKETRIKQELAEKNEELQQQNSEITAQSIQIEQQRKELEARNEKIEVLLREIHHRVKNNMQTISSLLNLQSAQIQDEKAKEAILEGRGRVKAMALIHQKLYQQENISQVDLREYIQKLSQDLMYSHGYRPHEVKCTLNVEHIPLDIDKAIPLCLIINEVITNFYKYGVLESTSPHLNIDLTKSEGFILLKITDNGKGITDLKAIEVGNTKSFGWRLIHSLTKQLSAHIHLQNKDGLQVQLKIPISESA
jgi:two-component sensor histidine kinase/tetratricopeptide (TPR) repeat protein